MTLCYRNHSVSFSCFCKDFWCIILSYMPSYPWPLILGQDGSIRVPTQNFFNWNWERKFLSCVEAIKCKTQELSATTHPAMWNWSATKKDETNMQKQQRWETQSPRKSQIPGFNCSWRSISLPVPYFNSSIPWAT